MISQDGLLKVLENLLTNQKKIGYNVLADFEAECKSEIIAIAKKNNPSFKLVNKISRYGKTSNYDFFAEVFANSQSSEPNELGLAMEQWLKEKGY